MVTHFIDAKIVLIIVSEKEQDDTDPCVLPSIVRRAWNKRVRGAKCVKCSFY